MSARLTQNIRSDALRNRERLLDAARTSFARKGLNVTMREIASRAEVGVATLYRHFPHRQALISAAFAEQVEECLAQVSLALEDPDPWHALITVVEQICSRQAHDRGFNEALLGSAATSGLFVAERRHNVLALAELIRRARTAGALRPDVTPDDLRLVFAASAAVSATDPSQALVRARRLALLLLRGMRTIDNSDVALLAPGTDDVVPAEIAASGSAP